MARRKRVPSGVVRLSGSWWLRVSQAREDLGGAKKATWNQVMDYLQRQRDPLAVLFGGVLDEVEASRHPAREGIGETYRMFHATLRRAVETDHMPDLQRHLDAYLKGAGP